METEDRRGRWRQLMDALRPEAEAAALPGRSVRADILLALILTTVALFVAAGHAGGTAMDVEPPAVHT
ncbi:two-component sensor histidine kinase, partial [Streptomyces lavendulocolor]